MRLINKRLANQKVVYRNVGPLQHDENGVVEIKDEKLAKDLLSVRGYSVHTPPVQPTLPTELKEPKKPAVKAGKPKGLSIHEQPDLAAKQPEAESAPEADSSANSGDPTV